MTSATFCCLCTSVYNIVYIFFFIVAFLYSTFLILKICIKTKKFLQKRKSDVITIGFFHPYCNAGGGGERVLWTAIKAIQNSFNHIECIVYTGDRNVSKNDILEKVKTQLKIVFQKDINFIFLKTRNIVEAKHYPYFTLLLQSLASVVLGFEALWNFVPDVYIDTMGYAFTYPIFKNLGSCSTACYTHYPTISTDMLNVVSQRKVAINNKNFISNSKVLSQFKMIYYHLFASIYKFVGQRADVVMVNSSWTKGHITSLWNASYKIQLVYPPCDTSEFEKIPLLRLNKGHYILSIAQFRPEKNHPLQLMSLQKVLQGLSNETREQVKLIVIGGCRSDEDLERVNNLKKLSKELNIDRNVEFHVNLPFEDLITEMKNANFALHSMWNEHFGIGVVECMSAGLITIAHNTGGPKMDIVVDFNGHRTGFLAEDVDSYANALHAALKMTPSERQQLQENAREAVKRFSVSNFEKSFIEAIQPLFVK